MLDTYGVHHDSRRERYPTILRCLLFFKAEVIQERFELVNEAIHLGSKLRRRKILPLRYSPSPAILNLLLVRSIASREACEEIILAGTRRVRQVGTR